GLILFTETDRKVGHLKASLAISPTNVWCIASAGMRDKGLVHRFSVLLWESDCYDLRSEITGIDTRIPHRLPPAAYPPLPVAAYRGRHAIRLEHFRFPQSR